MYFDHTKKLVNSLLGIGVVCLIISVIHFFFGGVLDQVFLYGSSDYLKNAMVFGFFFLSGLFCVLLSVFLKSLIREASEELNSLRLKQEKLMK